MGIAKDQSLTFLGLNVYTDNHIPEGGMYIAGDRMSMSEEKLDDLKDEMAGIHTSTQSAMGDYYKLLDEAQADGKWGSLTSASTYYVQTSGTYDQEWQKEWNNWNTGQHSTSPRIAVPVLNITLNEPVINPTAKCVLCQEVHESTMLGIFTDSYCEQCLAAIEKVRGELFTEREDVYIHDINQLLEEQ